MQEEHNEQLEKKISGLEAVKIAAFDKRTYYRAKPDGIKSRGNRGPPTRPERITVGPPTILFFDRYRQESVTATTRRRSECP